MCARGCIVYSFIYIYIYYTLYLLPTVSVDSGNLFGDTLCYIKSCIYKNIDDNNIIFGLVCVRACVTVRTTCVAIAQQVFFYRARADEMMIFNTIRINIVIWVGIFMYIKYRSTTNKLTFNASEAIIFKLLFYTFDTTYRHDHSTQYVCCSLKYNTC